MNEKEKQDLLAMGGQKLVDMVTRQGADATKDLEGKGIAHKNYAEFADRITAIAEMVADEAIKTELINLAAEMAEYGAMEGGAEMLMEEEYIEEAMASSEGKQTVPNAEELGNAFKTVLDTLREEIVTSKKETIGEVAAALEPLTKAVAALRASDGEKIKNEMEQTPAASLMTMVTSAIGAKETEVKADDPLLEQKPKETPAPPRDGSGLASFIAAMINGQEQ